MKNQDNLSLATQKIINTCCDLLTTGRTSASSGERIAAALVLNRKDLLPDGFSIAGAWLVLTPAWKQHVLDVQRHHMHRICPRNNVVNFPHREAKIQ